MIKEAQKQEAKLSKIVEQVQQGKKPDYLIKGDGWMNYKNRLCVPNIDNLKKSVMKQAYDTSYTMHPGGNKMYQTLKPHY